ncbi:DUF5949 family protein [Streptomyces cellostaticus]|uniref:DUF5949 family protein n=1 Tax=Streptomyces cellostaticus TaxID=67285 RepID=UPI002026F2CF|nr:DUF5949 family protein [Streptomyces cellostaticus]
MTSAPSAPPARLADLGTLVVLAWSGAAPDGTDMPCLLGYSPGDAEGGPEVTAVAVERLLVGNGLPVGGELVDGTKRPSLPVTLRVRAGQAVVLTLRVRAGQTVVDMPQFVARADTPPQWLAAVAERGYAYLVFTTRAWPEGEPGTAVEPAAPAAFAGAEETLRAAAQVVLPVRRLRG